MAASLNPTPGGRTSKEKHARPTFLALQHPRLEPVPPSGVGWRHEIKWDGYRMQLHVLGGRATWFSRNGNDWSDRFLDLSAEAETFKDCILDGELVAIAEDGRPSFSRLRAEIGHRQAGKRTMPLVFMAFDILRIGRDDLRAEPLRHRLAQLEALLDGADQFRVVDALPGGGADLLKAACGMKLEGIVSKRLDSPYTGGEARLGTWIKAKCRPGQEVVIGGWRTEGSRFKGILAGVYQRGDLTYIGSVQTGFGGHEGDKLLQAVKARAVDRSPFIGRQPTRTGRETLHWAKPELIANVEFAEFTASGKMRQASFKGLRDDKAPEEVTLELIDPPPQTAPPIAKPSVARASTIEIHGVTISNPDKPLWPARDGRPAVTKADLARYYATVAEWMLPYVRGRPCTLLVAPDGIEGPTTYVRHEGHWQGLLRTSKAIRHITVAEKDKTYPVFDTVQALVTLAEMAAIEVHPWGSLPDEPMVPGMLVFDLDPEPGQPFEAVVSAARELNGRLLDYGLVGFEKTSGQRGLHVVAPFSQTTPPISWATAKAFGERICREMAADRPDLYTVALTKSARRGRLFLDYLRNDPGHHAVGLLSPRATPEATVSMPVHLSSLEAGDVRRWTVRTAVAALREHDPWKYFDAAARPLATAVERMGL